ncbi:class I SAM-dependent methyltransferase [Legionella sp. MW5194]|uniref:class I SAM-dependent methyltransferase n=1 Tax=Legionella sp. MW5194 TaxID=2662448 RepID=UPI00351C55CB
MNSLSNPMHNLAIGYEEETLLVQAQALAASLHLPLDNQASNRLVLTPERLELRIQGFKPQYADFSSRFWQRRRDAGKQQGLVKACKPVAGMRLLDVTAGWGRDAAILASFGADVYMLERNAVMAALLMDALARRDPRSREVLHLHIQHQDAHQYLNELTESEYPDVIYMDPMHPPRDKSALVKKDMQILQQLIGEDNDALALLTLAKRRVRQRVVVKWPQHAEPLAKPSRRIEGKTVRFDIYLP